MKNYHSNKQEKIISKRNSDLVEAMMEFGALICKPKKFLVVIFAQLVKFVNFITQEK